MKEGINSQYLLVVTPRRFVGGPWTNVSGTIYRASFDYGEVVAVRDEDTLLSAAASAAVGSNEFYFDVTASELYIDVATDPTGREVTASYELYFGTFDAHFYRDPLDAGTREVYFEPLIMRSPTITSNVSELIFGFFPAESTSVELSNMTAFFNRHVYDSSFHEAGLNLYHYLGELEISNIKLVYRGLISAVNYSDDRVSFRVLDRANIFSKEYRHPSDRQFFDEATFPAIDPDFKNRPIRKVFGVMEGVIGINYAYDETVSSSTNHLFALHSGTASVGSLTKTAAALSTTTRTYLDSASGLQVGDNLWIDSTLGPSFDEYPVVTAVGFSPDYVDHQAITNAAQAGDTVLRSFVGSVSVIMDGAAYRLSGEEWSAVSDGAKGILGVAIEQALLTTTPRMVGPQDTVYVRFYGEKASETLGGNPFGSDSVTTGTLTQGVVLLWKILRGALGLSESELATSSFTALAGSVTDQLGFQIPLRTGDDFPPLREVVSDILASLLLKLALDDSGKWAVSQTGPLSSATKSLTDDEILASQFSYSFDYQEILSDVLVDFAPSEINSRSERAGDLFFKTARETSTVAKRLHGVTRQKTFRSFHFKESEAEVLARRLSYYFGERRGTVRLKTKNRFFDTEIGDVTEVSRTRLPGFSFAQETERARDFTVSRTAKSLYEIELELDDQKGIEDNSGSW